MEFTLEQEADIRASYRDAKNPQKQIDILADLYACKKGDILEVLGLKQPTKSKRAARIYGPETKKKVLDAVLSGSMTQRQAADEFDVLIGTVAKWVQIARKEQAESSASIEPEPIPAVLFQPLPAADLLKVGAKLKELQTGLEGLCNFYDAFLGCTAICEDWSQIDNLILRAEGFLGGMKVAAELMKDEKGEEKNACTFTTTLPPAAPMHSETSLTPKKNSRKNYPVSLLFHCKACKKDHWRRIDGEETTASCKCGHTEEVQRKNLVPIEYTCESCGNSSFGLTNHTEPGFDAPCKCGAPVFVEYHYHKKRYQGGKSF